MAENRLLFMLSDAQRKQLELSTTDFDWLEKKRSRLSTFKKRKRELTQLVDSLEAKEKQSSETLSTPEKMKCYVTETTITTPGGTQYGMGEEIGAGNYGKVYYCRAENGKEIASKKRLEFKESPHLEAKAATQVAQTLYGYGSFFCPKKLSDTECKTLPHYLITPYFAGKDPEKALEDYFDAVAARENASSLVMFGLLTVFIAVAKAYKDFSEEYKFVHGDVQAKNLKLVLSSAAKELRAVIIDFDFTQKVGELTSGEAEFHQGSELNEKVPASPLQDVYSIGFFYDEMMKCLIEKEMYDSREKNNTSERGILNAFAAELDSLEALIEQMMFNEDEESFKERPSLATVLARLTVILGSAQLKFEKIESDDFSVIQILSSKPMGDPVQSPSSLGKTSLSSQGRTVFL